jgi:hypothetical protein
MNLSEIFKQAILEAKKEKPSAGLTKKQKSDVAKKAKAGKDIGKKGKGFEKLAKKAGGGEKGEKIAAAAMWKNIKEGEDHEVSMAQNSLRSIMLSCVELMDRLGDDERDIPGWIQDHISNAENFIDQAAQGFHELEHHGDDDDDHEEEDTPMIQPVDEDKYNNSIRYDSLYNKLNANLPSQPPPKTSRRTKDADRQAWSPIKANDLSLDTFLKSKEFLNSKQADKSLYDYLQSKGMSIVKKEEFEGIDEKKLTKAEKEEKEKIINSMAKKGGGKEKMGPKQYAIATAQAIKSAE